MRNAGPAIIIDQEIIYHSNLEFINRVIIYNNPAKIKAIPPTISYFQDIHKIINKINTGILCINNPNNIWEKLNPGSKTSKENIAKNNRNIIDKILGVQYTNLMVFFFIFILNIIALKNLKLTISNYVIY